MIHWWKNPAIIAPLILLFAGVFFLIYLLKSDLLISWYSIFYIIIFLVGTIWFKALKKYFFNSRLNDPNAFKVCLGNPVYVDKGYSYIIFDPNQKRHNEYFIRNIPEDLITSSIDINSLKTNKVIPANIQQQEYTDCCIVKLANAKIKKAIAGRNEYDTIPLAYISAKDIFIIYKKDQ